MKKLFVIVWFLSSVVALAQIEFSAKTAKPTVALNERFQINFEMNEDGDHFTPPDFSEFRVLAGPFQSVNYSWVNGVKSFKKSYSFVLQPTKKGNFTIGKASIEYQNKRYYTNTVKITVTKAVEQPQQQPQQDDDDRFFDPFRRNNQQPMAEIGEGLHLVAELSKKSAYVGEPVSIIYKIYFPLEATIGNLRNFKSPKYKDFWSQYLDLKELRAEEATYGGKKYAMAVLRKVIVYPLEAGNLPIEPFSLEVDGEIPSGRRDFFGRALLKPIQQKLSTAAHVIVAKPLPENGKPDNFTGAVGNFTFSATPNKTTLKAGESLDLTLKVSGNGNLKLFNLPKPVLPSVFEQYEPKHTENVNTPITGITGEVIDSYTLIPQYKGKYVIKPITFSYFDLQSQSYKTIASKEFEINVLEGEVNAVAQSSAKQPLQKATAFEYIISKTEFSPIVGSDFLGGKLFYSLLFFPVLAIPALILIRRKKQAQSADVVGNKLRNNQRLARKYLAEAKKQLGNKAMFYLALEKSLHNFLKAKLHIETSEMSKENINELLINKSVLPDTAANFIALMNDCEFARYAPSTATLMNNHYEKAIEIISELEKQIK